MQINSDRIKAFIKSRSRNEQWVVQVALNDVLAYIKARESVSKENECTKPTSPQL